MKVINIIVDENTFTRLENGELTLDVRVDEMPGGFKHSIGDMLIYSMRDKDGGLVENKNLAFLITTKVELEFFVSRIGEQMMRRDSNASDDLIIVTLAQVTEGR